MLPEYHVAFLRGIANQWHSDKFCRWAKKIILVGLLELISQDSGRELISQPSQIQLHQKEKSPCREANWTLGQGICSIKKLNDRVTGQLLLDQRPHDQSRCDLSENTVSQTHNGVLNRDKKSLIRLSEILHKGKGTKKENQRFHIQKGGDGGIGSQDFWGAT